VVEHPEAKVSKNIERIVRRLLALESEKLGPVVPPRSTDEQNFYEVLELDFGATDEEIRRAHKRAREMYAPEAMAVFGLFSPERLERVHQRIELAYDTLIDADRRRRYDVDLFPEGTRPTPVPVAGQAPAASAPAAQAVARPDETPVRVEVPEPEVTPETEFTGGLLKRIREARGVDLLEIAQRTKIGASHLRAIEDERWELMPAQVYLRGFLVEYARFLRLDANRVSRTFLERYHKARAGREG
jgi:flagellar biosynthesis protein FlhG